MLKKILIASTGLAMLATVGLANAGAVAVPVYPVTGKVKVKGTEETSGGGTKIFSGTADAKKLIRLAMGGDSEVPVSNEKNLVLGLVPVGDPLFTCSARIVVWSKTTSAVTGLVAAVNICQGETGQVNSPAEGKSGSISFLQTAHIKFESADTNCSALNHNQISGDVLALGEAKGKVSSLDGATATDTKFTRLLGDVSVASDGGFTVVDGEFSAKFAKPLGSTSQSLFVGCP